MRISLLVLAVVVTAIPAVAGAQAAGQSPSELILGTPTTPATTAGGGVLPAGGAPWPGVGNTTALGPAPPLSQPGPSSAIVATPSSPSAPLTVPDVGASTSSAADIATPAPNATATPGTTTPPTAAPQGNLVSTGAATVTGVGGLPSVPPTSGAP